MHQCTSLPEIVSAKINHVDARDFSHKSLMQYQKIKFDIIMPDPKLSFKFSQNLNSQLISLKIKEVSHLPLILSQVERIESQEKSCLICIHVL